MDEDICKPQATYTRPMAMGGDLHTACMLVVCHNAGLGSVAGNTLAPRIVKPFGPIGSPHNRRSSMKKYEELYVLSTRAIGKLIF
jgi:hypothetical protein